MFVCLQLGTIPKKCTAMDQLPLPQSYPPNTGPEIDPATLCFESPISLSSNDTSLNNMQALEPAMTQPVGGQSYYDYPGTAQQGSPMSSTVKTNLQQREACNDDCNERQAPGDMYIDNAPSMASDRPPQADYQAQQQCCYADPRHSSPLHMQAQHQRSPMFPPQQSPQVLIPGSPHMAPQSPQVAVPQKSPLMHPNSPHIPPQSPHFAPHASPMLSPAPQQTPYNPRCRTGSMSSKVTPPDLTPPPGTPSPSKHTPPDRYQQYLQQSRMPQKSPNVVMNSREMQCTAGIVPPALSQSMQNLTTPTGSPQVHQQAMGQHFFPSSQYLDSGYFGSYQQIAHAAAPAAVYNAQLPTGNTATAAMYRYH